MIARQAIADVFVGALVHIDAQHILTNLPHPTASTVYQGEIVVRYGVPYLMQPHLSIVPDLLALDYGQMLNGEEAWEFLYQKSNLYPRADVCGYRHDGVDEMLPVKLLDLMRPVQLLAYSDAQATTPLAPVSALVVAQPDALAERLRTYGTLFTSWQDWQAAQHER